MNNEFIPYELALKLKELGFNEPCFGFHFDHHIRWYDLDITYQKRTNSELNVIYKNNSETCTSPLYQQIFEWFRVEHNMLGNVYTNASGFLYEMHDVDGGTHRLDSDYEGPNAGGCWDTYEDARLALLTKLIQLVENGKR